MTLEQFAKKAGVEIIDSPRGFGGKYAYREKDSPNCATCGFKTKNAAYKHWLSGVFGGSTGRAVLALLRSTSTRLPKGE